MEVSSQLPSSTQIDGFDVSAEYLHCAYSHVRGFREEQCSDRLAEKPDEVVKLVNNSCTWESLNSIEHAMIEPGRCFSGMRRTSLHSAKAFHLSAPKAAADELMALWRSVSKNANVSKWARSVFSRALPFANPHLILVHVCLSSRYTEKQNQAISDRDFPLKQEILKSSNKGYLCSSVKLNTKTPHHIAYARPPQHR